MPKLFITRHQVSLNGVYKYRQMVRVQHQEHGLVSYEPLNNFRSRVVSIRRGCHGLHADAGGTWEIGNALNLLYTICSERLRTVKPLTFFQSSN